MISSVVVGLIVYFVTASDSVPEAKPLSTQNAATVASNTTSDIVTPQVDNDRFEQPNTTAPNIEEPTGPMAAIKFEQDMYDYGTIKQQSNNTHHFKFSNTGDVPLVISNAQGSCGCTVPSWPKEPILPGATGEIEVVFTPKKGQVGKDEKTVTITANIPTKTYTLKIRANVTE